MIYIAVTVFIHSQHPNNKRYDRSRLFPRRARPTLQQRCLSGFTPLNRVSVRPREPKIAPNRQRLQRVQEGR
jgi:hypothetical protein